MDLTVVFSSSFFSPIHPGKIIPLKTFPTKLENVPPKTSTKILPPKIVHAVFKYFKAFNDKLVREAINSEEEKKL